MFEEFRQLGDAGIQFLQERVAEFIRSRDPSSLLYRPDVNKAIHAILDDPEDLESYDIFIQCT